MSSKSSRKQKAVVEDPKDNVFLVEKVLDKRSGKAGRDEFLIQWQGFPPSDSSWEPRENLQCLQMLEDFERDFVKREKPTRKRRASAVEPPKAEEAAGEEKEKEKAVDPDDKYSLNGKQLRCILGLTKGPGELHFLCKFSDDTAQLLPSKEVNSRYRPFVDEYSKFLHRRLEKRQKRMDEGKKKGHEEEDEDDEWPQMPPGMRILTSEEQEQKLREESRNREPEEMNQTFQLTATDLLHDMQMAADSHFLSSFQSDPMEEPESTALSEPLLSVFDDRSDSPLPCPIVIDTVDNDDDDVLLFPPAI